MILPDGFSDATLNDSKQLSKNTRERLRQKIEAEATAWAVAHVFEAEIDRVNILNASILAMHRAVEKLEVQPAFIAVDGNRFKPYNGIEHHCIVKGDGKYLHIAAASILAKTHRDAYMEKLHREFPMYGWEQNKGYPTAKHREAIVKNGITDRHRKSFRLIPEQLEMALP